LKSTAVNICFLSEFLFLYDFYDFLYAHATDQRRKDHVNIIKEITVKLPITLIKNFYAIKVHQLFFN